MSDPINANPNIVDVSNLPTRLVDGEISVKESVRLVEKIKGLSLFRPDHRISKNYEIPDLIADSEDISSIEELDIEENDSYLTEEVEEIDEQEIFDLICTISDPEHPLTLAQLAVVNLPDIKVINGANRKTDISEVIIKITPTITHCSLATLIGLGIRVRLERCLPPRFRIKILIKEGTHQSENQVNKQLNDKERVAAACENDQLLSVILQMLSTCK